MTLATVAGWGSVVGSAGAQVDDAQLAEAVGRREAKWMSRTARLATTAALRALKDAGWSGSLEDVGYFLGVGAAGGRPMALEGLLEKSQDAGALSMEKVGEVGLRSLNPMFILHLPAQPRHVSRRDPVWQRRPQRRLLLPRWGHRHGARRGHLGTTRR